MKKIILAVFLLTAFDALYSQPDSTAYGDIEIYLIDSYITPEPPHKFVLSYFTSDSCTSKLVNDKNEFVVSKKLTDNHKTEIALEKLNTANNIVYFRIFVEDRDGNISESQLYDVDVPQNMNIAAERDAGLLQMCCFGGIIFGLPAPTLVMKGNEKFFALSKEIPIFSFYTTGYNYPFGYISAEYSYIFKSDKKNFFRTGYKQIFQLEFIKYASAGVNYFTDFEGYNGISPEISLGLFQIQNVFTVFTRYRYNFQPDRSGTDFHELSIGLYSNFFSINF
ncbi:MAG: hypothetical protein HYS25_04335 [Ignavibacteriales bacterium]|nr:hypothetical protein [Ignavibacteriales bacterium]